MSIDSIDPSAGRWAARRGGRALVAALCVLALLPAGGCSEGGAQVRADGASAGGREIGWNELKAGMAPDEVLRTLGEPLDVKVEPINTVWYYSTARSGGPFVVFDTHGMTVSHWRRAK